jgi:Tfp pilus assembly protein PilV
MRTGNIIRRQQQGFLILEVMLGIALLVLFISAIGYTLLYGQENTIAGGDRVRATYITEKAIEAARAIRDASYSSLTAGNHGVYVNPATDKWSLTGSTLVSSGGYTTMLTVSSVTSDWLRLSAQTKWKHGYPRSGSVLITSELTNWRSTASIGNWSSITVQGTYTDGGTPNFNEIAVASGGYAFVTSASANGLYVIDIRNLASPTRINSSFDLGTAGYGITIIGEVAYVITGDNSQEIRAYDIASPSTFDAPQLLGSYNIPGSGRARSIAVSGDKIYVGTTASAAGGEEEFYAFAVNGGTITLLDSVNDDSSSIESIALSGTAAYLASSMDTSELRVVNIASGSNLTLVGGYNLSDRTLDAVTVTLFGTSALLGTLKGSSIEEAVLFDITNGGVPSSPGPWYHEGSGSILGMDIEPSRCYAFISAQSWKKALQVFNIRDKSTLAELTTYNSTTGAGRGVQYDPTRDRVYLLTEQSLIIFQPGSYTGVCP